MPAHQARSAVGDINPAIAMRPSNTVLLHPARFAQQPWVVTDTPDRLERKHVRRARRQALALMVVSGVVSVALLYGAWSLLARLVFSAG